MDDLLTLALGKVVRDAELKTARAEIAPGTYPIDSLVRLRGGLKVGKDNPDAKIAARIPDRAFMLWTLSKMNGATRDRTVREFKEWLDGGGQDDLDAPDLSACWDAVLESTRGLRKGTVTHTLVAELVEADVAETAVPSPTVAIA